MGVYVLPNGASQPKHLDINLSSPNVYQTVKDKAGNLWIATYNGGVNMYNGKRVFWPRNIKGYPKFSHFAWYSHYEERWQECVCCASRNERRH